MVAINSRNEISWDESYEGNKVPKGIAIEITTKDFGVIRREFALLDPPAVSAPEASSDSSASS